MTETRSFRILSLDGGGIRGAFSAAFLAEIEQEVGGLLHEHFDLIAGTSTGGIIAIALALGEPAERVVEFYRRYGPAVFARRRTKRSYWKRPLAAVLNRFTPQELDVDWVTGTKYASGPLEEGLGAMLGDRSFLAAKTRLVIPAVDVMTGRPVVFKTPHLAGANTRDRHFSAVEIARATAAAPTYFPHATCRRSGCYVDGGLWANNPVLVALAEASAIRTRGLPPISGDAEVQVLSIGTGHVRASINPPGESAGIGWWSTRLVDCFGIAQAEGTHSTARFLLGDSLVRVDFELPDASWRLDGIEYLSQLEHHGRLAAHCKLAGLHEFFEPKVERVGASDAA